MERNHTNPELSWMPEKLVLSEEGLDIFLGRLKVLLPSLHSELESMRGKDGRLSLTVLSDTVMRWYDTLSLKDEEKVWTLIVNSFTPLTPLGMH
jgi:hypothetical protein